MEIKNYQNIHFAGIGGIGLSAIAEMLVQRGYNISGSDTNASEITKKLEQKGVKIYKEHKKENLENVDLLLYSAAIKEDNPERIKAKEDNIDSMSRSEILGLLMDEYKNSIAVSGTHGKTTTTSMISVILDNAKLDPTILVGGYLSNIDGNIKIGDSNYFITEACEYKVSFLDFRPKYEVILNIDEDHLDFFEDLDDITKSFKKFTNNLVEGGLIFANIDDEDVIKATRDKSNVITFGKSENADYKIKNIRFNEFGFASYDIEYDGNIETVNLALPGEHNIYNSAAAFACSHSLGVNSDIIIETLKNLKGAKRRFEHLDTVKNNIRIVDDYAHHPTEIKKTLQAAKKISHNRIWCIFQSHTYTRTSILLDDFAKSLLDADEIIIAKIYAAREINVDNISGQDLADKINSKNANKNAKFIEAFDDIVEYVSKNAKDDDIIITMGAGNIDDVGYALCDVMK